MKSRLKTIAGASLLFLGVMLLTSCATAPKERQEIPQPPQQPSQPREAETSEKNLELSSQEIQKKLTDLNRRVLTLEDLETRVKALEQKVETKKTDIAQPNPSQDAQPLDTKPEQLYNRARSLLLEENFTGASELFQEYVKKFPDSELADNSLYWLGECYYSQKDYGKAIKTFKDVVTLYPKRDKVPDALLKTAYAYLKLDDSDRAHHYLKLVVKGYPFTPAGEKADQKLKAFQ